MSASISGYPVVVAKGVPEVAEVMAQWAVVLLVLAVLVGVAAQVELLVLQIRFLL